MTKQTKAEASLEGFQHPSTDACLTPLPSFLSEGPGRSWERRQTNLLCLICKSHFLLLGDFVCDTYTPPEDTTWTNDKTRAAKGGGHHEARAPLPWGEESRKKTHTEGRWMEEGVCWNQAGTSTALARNNQQSNLSGRVTQENKGWFIHTSTGRKGARNFTHFCLRNKWGL